MKKISNNQIAISRIISDIKIGIPIQITNKNTQGNNTQSVDSDKYPKTNKLGYQSLNDTIKSKVSSKKNLFIAAEAVNWLYISENYTQKFITTKERLDFINSETAQKALKKATSTDILSKSKIPTAFLDNSLFQAHQTPEEDAFINLCKLSHLEPVALSLTDESDYQINTDQIQSIDISDIDTFTKTDQFNIYKVSEAPLTLQNAQTVQFTTFRCQFLSQEHYAIIINDPFASKSPIVRVHSSCYTGDLLGSLTCDCRDQLQNSIKSISENTQYSGGLILYIAQEGRGIGLSNKIKAYSMQRHHNIDTVDSNLILGFKEDERTFQIAQKILEHFNIQQIDLLTNNKSKVNSLQSQGIKINKMIPTSYNPTKHNEHYLATKSSKMGHKFKETPQN